MSDGTPKPIEMTMRDIGRKGGQTTSARHGPEFYSRIGRKGGAKVRKLIEQGKRQIAKDAAE